MGYSPRGHLAIASLDAFPNVKGIVLPGTPPVRKFGELPLAFNPAKPDVFYQSGIDLTGLEVALLQIMRQEEVNPNYS